MKHMKKLFAVMLTLAMVMSMAVSVSAATKVFTKQSPATKDALVDGHTYKAYKILTSNTVVEGKLVDATWAEGVKDAAKTALLKGADSIDAMIEALGSDNDSDAALEFAEIAYANKGNLGDGIEVTSGDTKLGIGYFLIVDESVETAVPVVNRAYLYYNADTDAVITITPKAEAPSSEKKIKDINDSEDENFTNWQDSADHDVGDQIPFKLTATLPSDYTDYKTYSLTFHDQEGGGLKFVDGSVKVYLDENTEEIASNNYTVTQNPTDGDTFDVAFTNKNLQDIGVKNGSVIRVEYLSELTAENVVYGQAGNPNTSWITYTNNQNSEQGGENGETPKDTVIAFTYKTVINKTDKNGAPLGDADFTLYKEVKDGTTTGAQIKEGFNDDIKAKAAALEDEKYYIEIGGDKKTTSKKNETDEKNSVFTFAGLDDGNYVVVETAVPSGYNGAEALAFPITATHTKNNIAIDPTTGYIDGTETFVLTALESSDNFETVVATGTLSANVMNKKGSELPETGGIGTTIFYTVGAILVAGAGIVLVTRRRMAA
ncbi:MAG: isopeptide-forming domain-containing fimbrial protein [Lachnospiraceae bacterium]|nr:isopeptide-forming domain-containing fimbrial protein [Lachnospiraceae bacterium]